MAGPCSPKQSPVPFTVLSNLFVWMLCSRLETFKFSDRPHSPTTLVTAQLILRRWRIISFWCYADAQPRSNERMLVLPQTRSRGFYGVEELFRLDGMKLFKNIRTCGWVVLPQTGPSSFHKVDQPLRLDVLQSFKNIQNDGWAALPSIFVTAQLISRRWKIISFWCYADIQQRLNEWMVVLPQTRSRSFHGVEKVFRLDGMKLFKNIRTYGWVVLPQTRPSFFHDVEEPFRLDVMQPIKNIQAHGWAALPNIPCHGPAQLTALKNHFVM